MPPPNTSRQKKKEDSCETSELFSAATSYFKNRTEDDADVIAKGWALKIRRLAADQRRYAEKIINDVLFEGEGEFEGSGAVCDASE